MNNLISCKKFLDLEGLEALIFAMGNLRAEYAEGLGELSGVNTDILYRLDNLLKDGTDLDGRVGIESGKEVIISIVEFIEQLRKEIGDPKDAKEDSIYERITDIEDLLSEFIDYSKSTAFSRVVSNYDRDNQKIFIKFLADNDEWIDGKNPSAEDMTSGNSVVIDTADFVFDGMLSDVKAVTVYDEPVPEYVGFTEPGAYITVHHGDGTEANHSKYELEYKWDDIPVEYRINGARYLIFTFKVESTLPKQNRSKSLRIKPEDKDKLSDIWLDMSELHSEYIFKTRLGFKDKDSDSTTRKYIEYDVTTENTGVAGSTAVTYRLRLRSRAIDALQQVAGEYKATENSKTNRGLLQTEKDVAALEVKMNKVGEAIWDPKQGVIHRLYELEGNQSDIIDWLNNSIISADTINDLFDYWIMSDGFENEAKDLREYTLENVKTLDDFKGNIPELTKTVDSFSARKERRKAMTIKNVSVKNRPISRSTPSSTKKK